MIDLFVREQFRSAKRGEGGPVARRGRWSHSEATLYILYR
jgi:hypothetical protein